MSVTLKSSDGQEFKIPEEACALSRYLQNQIQNGKSNCVIRSFCKLLRPMRLLKYNY